MSSLNLSPLIAEAAFEKMLPSDFVLGIDESSEDGFSIVGIHLKVLVGKPPRIPWMNMRARSS